MSATTTPIVLAGLASKLTDPADRETYASLISFIDSLPENDELFRMAQLLGLVSLAGQRIPEAVAAFLEEFRAQTVSSAAYQKALDARLAKLPEEIASGVDAGKIAVAMSERFRQQIASIGLQDSASALQGSVNQVRALSAEFTAALKPIPEQYRGIGNALASDLAKLRTANNELCRHNTRLVARADEYSFILKAAVVGVVFIVGVLCGVWYERAPDCPVVSAPVPQAAPAVRTAPRPKARR